MNMHGLCYLRKPYRRLYKFHLYTLPIHLYTHFIYNSMIHQKNIYIYIYILKRLKAVIQYLFSASSEVEIHF